MKALSYIDMIGPKMKFRVQKKEKYHSPTGGVLTCIYIIVCTLAFIGFGKDIFEKKNPNVTFNRKIGNESNTLFHLTSFNFATAVFNQATAYPISNFTQRFSVYVDVFDNKGDGKYAQSTIYLVSCNKTYLEQIKDKLRTDPAYYMCLPEGTSIALRGIFLKGNYVSARLNVDYCTPSNSESNIKCIPKEESQRVLNNTLSHVIITDHFTDSYNYDDPFVTSYFSETTLSTPMTLARQWIYLKSIDFETDRGWIMEDVEIQHQSAVEKAETTTFYNPNTSTIYSHLIVNSMWRDVYKRSYNKIQGVIALIGGFASVGLAIFRRIYQYIIFPDILKVFFHVYSDGKHFSLKVNTSNNTVNNNTTAFDIVQPKVNNFTRNNTDQIMNHREGKAHSSSIQQDNILQSSKTAVRKRKDKMHFSFCDKILRGLCWKSQRLAQACAELKIVENIFNQMFSMEHFSNISRRVKLFELLLFDEYQRKLLNVMELPIDTKHFNFNERAELYKDIRVTEANNIINANIQNMLC